MGPFHHAGELPHAGDALDGPPASTLIPPIAPTCRGSLSGRPHAGLRRESARRRSKGKDFAIVTFLLPARGCPRGRFDLTSRINMSPSKRAVDSR